MSEQLVSIPVLAKAVSRQLTLRTLICRDRVHGTVPLETVNHIIDEMDRQLCGAGQPLMRTRFEVTNQTYKRWVTGEIPMPWNNLLNAVKEAESCISGLAGAAASVRALELAAQIVVQTNRQIKSRFKSKRSDTKTWLQGWNANYPLDDKPCYSDWVSAPEEFDLDVASPALSGTRVPFSEINPEMAIWLPIKGHDLVCGVWHDCIVDNKPIPVVIALRKFTACPLLVVEFCRRGPTTLDEIAIRFFATGQSPTIMPIYHRLQWWLAIDHGPSTSCRSYLTDQSAMPRVFHSKTAALRWYLNELEQRPIAPLGSEGMYGTLLPAKSLR